MTTHEEVLEAAAAALYDVLVARHLDDATLWSDLNETDRAHYRSRVRPILLAISEVLAGSDELECLGPEVHNAFATVLEAITGAAA